MALITVYDHYIDIDIMESDVLIGQWRNRKMLKDILVEPGLHIYKTCTINKLVVYTNII